MQPYGGFWIRVLAYIIDWMVLQLATSLLMLFVTPAMILAPATGSTNGAVAIFVFVMIGAFLVPWLYSAILESSHWQGTLGKQALKLVVTDERGERIGFGRATGRYFAKILSAMILLFGFFMVGWTQRKQGLHDLIAGTLVQRADSVYRGSNSAKVFE